MGEAKRKNTRLYFEALTKLYVLKCDVRTFYKIGNISKYLEHGGNKNGHNGI